MRPSQDLALADVLRDAIRTQVADVHTSFPATVVSYDRTTQKATVQPVVRHRYTDEDGEIHDEKPPVIPSVPVLFPSATGYAITFDLTPGDPVFVHVAERSTDEWRATGLVDVTALDLRRFDLSDAFCVPGGRPFSSPVLTGGVSASGMVVQAPAIYLVSSTSVERYILGDTFLTALGSALGDVQAALAAFGLPALNLGALITNIATSLGPASAPYLSAKIKGQ